MNKRMKKVSVKLNTFLIFFITFILSFLILISAIATKKYDLKAGDIAKNTIKAPREIVDERATEAARKEATQNVDIQFAIKADVQKTAEENIRLFFSKIIDIVDTEEDTDKKINKMMASSNIHMDREGYEALLALNKSQLTQLQSILIETLGKAYANPIESQQSDIENAKLIAESKISQLDYSRTLKDTLKILIYSQIKPNYVEDKEKTEEMAKKAEQSTPTVVIKKDQIVVNEGELVTEHQIELLKTMGLLNNSKFDYFIYISLALLVIVVIFLEFSIVNRSVKSKEDFTKRIILISTINIFSLLLARLLSFVSPLLVPFAFGPMIMCMLLDSRTSLIMGTLNAVLLSVAVNFNVQAMMLIMMSVLMGSIILKKMQQRNDIIMSSLYICVVNTIITLSSGLILSNHSMEILINVAYTAVAGAFSGILAIGTLPLFESAFDIVTNVKLLELSNPNNPLLKKLIMESPGTYNHSMLVANLSELAAEEIGANAILARVASYYHDVGKTVRPLFFKENQMNMENPHNKIDPDLSALIIISHVKDGLELADKYKIPRVIKDIIIQHHGTTLVKYFYVTAKNMSDNPEEINIDDYMYPGPTPQTKEGAIIMLADSVEAAVRSIKEPTEENIKSMIDNIVQGKIDDHQLDDSDLTFKDLKIIKKCFQKTVNSIYHQRIEYPTEKIKEKLKK